MENDVLETLIEHHYSIFRMKAFMILRETHDAEDAVQSACYKAWLHQEDITAPAHYLPWLYQIVYHESIDILRNRKRSSLLAQKLLPIKKHENDPAQVIADCMTIQDAIHHLPEIYALPIHMYYQLGYSVDEIAAVLRIPSGTINSRLARARKLIYIEYSM